MNDRSDTDDCGGDGDDGSDRDHREGDDDYDDSDDRRFPFRRRRIDRNPGRMRAFRLAYDGRPFRGFQRQPDVPTVEDALFDALRALDVWPDAGSHPGGDAAEQRDPDRPDRPPGYAAAGRTDAGVSALAQTVAFACPAWLTPSALNSQLPASIRAWASADVSPTFHATHDAVEREYTYFLHAPTSGDAASESDNDDAASERTDGNTASERTDGNTASERTDDERVRTVLRRLTGRHDFHNLTPEDEGTVRELGATVDRDGEFLTIRVAADGFPREFVRRLVRLLGDVWHGAVDLAFVERVLESTPLSGSAGVGPARPEPLVLSGVGYPDCEFERDPDAVASAVAVFRGRRVDALANARVAGFVRDGVADGPRERRS